MKRLDRAMYAFFLLALLADMARSQVPASIGGDSTGGSILSAASQIRVGPAGEVMLVSRRPERIGRVPLPVAKFPRSRLALSRWARFLAAPSSQSALVLLLAAPFHPDDRAASPERSDYLSAASSRAVFEHTGSPAP